MLPLQVIVEGFGLPPDSVTVAGTMPGLPIRQTTGCVIVVAGFWQVLDVLVAEQTASTIIPQLAAVFAVALIGSAVCADENIAYSEVGRMASGVTA
jgi:hypothetical protein